MKLFKESKEGTELYLGEISNGIYSRRVVTRHMYKYIDYKTQESWDGWTVDKDAFEQKILPTCSYMIIRDAETEILYSCSVVAFHQNATPLRDRYFLKLEFWKQEKNHQAFKRVEVFEKQ